jgi:RNA polymerase sigma-70 factor (ECF subfamily)
MSEHSEHQQYFLGAYDEYGDAIFRFCFAKTSNRDTALDITQDTFTKTWIYLTEGKEIKNMRAFLYQVARNLITDHFRKKKSSSLDAILEEGIDFGHEEHERMKDTLNAAQSVAILNDLKDQDRDILIMRFIEDMEIVDIAEALNEKENTVSVRIHRALKKAEVLMNKKNTYE